MTIKMKKDPEELRGIGKRLVARVRATFEEIRGARGIPGLLFAAPKVVEHVEILGEELGLIGEDKKALAVQAVLDLVPDRWIPDWVLEPIVGWAVERGVLELKKRGPAALQRVRDVVKAKFGS